MEKKLVAECEAYAKEYMDYLSVAKTERRAYAQAVKLLEKAGFKEISSVKTLKPGDKVYRGYHGKTVMAAVIGRKPVADGIRVVGGHTDAPRLDLKPKPLYEKDDVVYFDTHIYGGIKKYQWLVLPLAIYGTIVKKDGKKVDVAIGESEHVRKKPAPDTVLEVMRQVGATKEQVVYIGDSDVDIATAANCGIPCISVLWGFRDRDFLLAHGATSLVEKPSEILE